MEQAGRTGRVDRNAPLNAERTAEKPQATFFEIFNQPVSLETQEQLLALKANVQIIRKDLLLPANPCFGEAIQNQRCVAISEFRMDWYENYFTTCRADIFRGKLNIAFPQARHYEVPAGASDAVSCFAFDCQSC